jgi:hypothetical protein
MLTVLREELLDPVINCTLKMAASYQLDMALITECHLKLPLRSGEVR